MAFPVTVFQAPSTLNAPYPPHHVPIGPDVVYPPPMPADADNLRDRLATLKSEHRDLDITLARLVEQAPFDQLQIQRLKRRKLLLKDMIARIETSLSGTTSAVVRRDRSGLEARLQLLRDFAAYGLSWADGAQAKITGASRATAEAFLRALPDNKSLPKLSPDGEGGVMMVWEAHNRTLLVTADESVLHTVFAAATPDAVYLNDIPFNAAKTIPREILDAIPTATTAVPA